jgi:hypothetical protein
LLLAACASTGDLPLLHPEELLKERRVQLHLLLWGWDTQQLCKIMND